ncbi:MFS transporter [Kitasatospora viridis]|uniref:DHA2 family methylenomycin A resistance protein-like MFS transporter n=1 Tax=Kitasatospora viridis TaxID=281105 RepID=A0A561TTC0_9ACTN|nr:MFS transporter [Kitasatospora viridis]TWF90358.1 DHA2 family methylenomycin A resistance protein-like MFS transporter [Kitasatospora viridis]
MSTAVRPDPSPATARPAPPPPAGRTRALIGIALGYFMVLLDTTVLAVAEPDLARSLGASTAGLQWAVTGYSVAFGALLLSAGAVADRYGAHRSFRYGVALFGLGSALSALAPDLTVLVVLRALLGVAAAACVPASMALISHLYPVPAERARAIAVWAAVSGCAMAFGPAVGGVLVGLAGWRSVFWVNVPLAVLVLALVAGPAVRVPAGRRRIDWWGQLAACAVLALVTDVLIALGSGDWTHAGYSAAAAAVVALLFAARERRSPAPVLAGPVLRAPGMRPVLLAGAAVNFTMLGVLFVLPLLLQRTLHLSPALAGAAFLPMTLPPGFNPLLTGRLVAKVGPWRPALAGLALLTLGCLVFALAVLVGTPYPLLAVGLLAAGFGVSFALPALITAVMSTAPTGTAGAAGGLLNAARQVGATLGVAVMGAFAGSTGGTAVALLLPALACAAAGAVLLPRLTLRQDG